MRGQARKWTRIARWVVLPAALMALGLTFWMSTALSAKEAKTTRSATTDATPKSNMSLQEKADLALENDQKILQQFDAIKEELRIIKIRASQPPPPSPQKSQ